MRIPALQPGRRALDRRYPTRDRKSTRLNSSHLVISYAVFCLKKKKNNLPTPLIAQHDPLAILGDEPVMNRPIHALSTPRQEPAIGSHSASVYVYFLPHPHVRR